jgi:hypothetical protein
MSRKHHPEFDRGFMQGWWWAAAFYTVISAVLVLGFHALGVHAP